MKDTLMRFGETLWINPYHITFVATQGRYARSTERDSGGVVVGLVDGTEIDLEGNERNGFLDWITSNDDATYNYEEESDD